MAGGKISDMTAGLVANLAADTSDIEVSNLVGTAPVTRRYTFGNVAQWLRQVGFAAAIAAAASPAAINWVFGNASGADNAAGSFTLTAPLSTGAATAASLNFKTGVAGASSSTLQSTLTRLAITPNGAIFGQDSANATLRAALEVNGPNKIVSYGDSVNGRARFTQVTLANANLIDMYQAGGTVAVPTATGNNSQIGGVAAGGFDGTAWAGQRANFSFNTAEVWAVGAHGTNIQFVTTAVGTDVQTTVVTFGAAGTITQVVSAVNSAAVVSTGYSLTGSNATNMVSYAGTWNTSGTPTALRVAITNTASNAASLLMNLLAGAAGTTSMFKVDVAGAGTFAADLTIGQAGVLTYNSRSRIWSNANGQLTIYNNGDTAGVGFDFTTDALLKIRNRAQNAYATIDALAYKVSGVAGADFGPGLPTSITVVKGIVTAIS